MIDLIEIGTSALKEIYDAANKILGAESRYAPPVIPADVTHRRGQTLVHQATAEEMIEAARQFAGEKVPHGFRGVDLGGMRQPLECLRLGGYIQGEVGSGKSSLFDRLRYSIAPLIGSGCGATRIVDFDDKGALLGKWYTMLPPDVLVQYFQPLAANSVYWALYKDFRTAADALQLATMIVSEGSGGSENAFWYTAARFGLFAYILTLQRFGGPWGIPELVAGPANQKVFHEILKLLPETRPFAKYFDDNREGRSVHSTLQSCLAKYWVVAACQARTKERFSVSEFENSEGVLVLGYDPAATAAIMGLHQLIVQRLSETALRRQDTEDRTLFIFDEFRLWNTGTASANSGARSPAEALVTTAFRGRSSGSGLFAGSQQVMGVDHVFGRNVSRELLGNLCTKIFLVTSSIESARYASETIGGHEVIQSTWGESWNYSGGNRSYTRSLNRSVVRRELATVDEVMALPKARWDLDQIVGYGLNPFTPPYRFQTKFRDVALAIRPPIDFVPNPPRPPKHQRLRPFGLRDAEALKLPPRPALLKLLR
ncbi:MAG: type IV secretion system DNA-binding domain-containing protein [Gemmataceae bacterium]